jgi:hypothetical protein
MKLISTYTILFVVLISLGCKKWVKEDPLSDGILDQFYKSKYDADAALAGMYGQFQVTILGRCPIRQHGKTGSIFEFSDDRDALQQSHRK